MDCRFLVPPWKLSSALMRQASKRSGLNSMTEVRHDSSSRNESGLDIRRTTGQGIGAMFDCRGRKKGTLRLRILAIDAPRLGDTGRRGGEEVGFARLTAGAGTFSEFWVDDDRSIYHHKDSI